MADRHFSRVIALAQAFHWRTGAELGLMRGETFLRLLHACPDLHLIGVGLWAMAPTRDERFEALNRTAGNRATLVRASTEEAASAVSDGSLDFLLINRRLPLAEVPDALAAWASKMKLGGPVILN